MCSPVHPLMNRKGAVEQLKGVAGSCLLWEVRVIYEIILWNTEVTCGTQDEVFIVTDVIKVL